MYIYRSIDTDMDADSYMAVPINWGSFKGVLGLL